MTDLQMNTFTNFKFNMNESMVTLPAYISLEFTIPSLIPMGGFLSLTFPEFLFGFINEQCYLDFSLWKCNFTKKTIKREYFIYN